MRCRSAFRVVKDDPFAGGAIGQGLEQAHVFLATYEYDPASAFGWEHAKVFVSVPDPSLLIPVGLGEGDVVIRRQEVRGQQSPTSGQNEDVVQTERLDELGVHSVLVELPGGEEPERIVCPTAVVLLYVTDSDDEKVYAYTTSGERRSGSDFHLDDEPGPIVHADGLLYVVGWSDGHHFIVRAYTTAGERRFGSDFYLSAGNSVFPKITYGEGLFYVTADVRGEIFVYTAAGEFRTRSDL